VFVHDTNHKGNVAELVIATELAKLGIPVMKPLTEHERYDLVVDLRGRLLRVQCKWAALKGDVVSIHLSRSRRRSHGLVSTPYLQDEIDLLAAYCGDLERCYVLPADRIAGMYTIHLRLAPPRNGQRAALNFASEYELGAVAQWEERRYGIPEAGGSSPPSSIGRLLPGCLVREQLAVLLLAQRRSAPRR
jgi:hypothetical protein